MEETGGKTAGDMESVQKRPDLELRSSVSDISSTQQLISCGGGKGKCVMADRICLPSDNGEMFFLTTGAFHLSVNIHRAVIWLL